MGQTLFDKLWDLHRVKTDEDGADLIAVDRLMLHERTGAVALKALANRGLKPFDPKRVFAVMDHVVSFRDGRGRDEARSPGGEVFITETRRMALAADIHLIDSDDARQGIVHVIAPELGIALPGLTVLCPDSHTCSLGALGALAWGIGSGDAEHVLATGMLRVRKPKQMRVEIVGELQPGVSAKDIALALIGQYGAAGGQRMAIEFSGSAVAALPMEARLTLCNLAVEFGAFTALIEPDQATLDYVKARPLGPGGQDEAAAMAHWRSLSTERGARFDRTIRLDISALEPMISWGTSPEDVVGVQSVVPAGTEDTLRYMDILPGERLVGKPVDGVFIGSCTNGRLDDLRAAAAVLDGQRVADGVRAVCVPGSKSVRRSAEAEGLDQIFKEAGFEWGEPGCAMCFYAGGETFPVGSRVVSSTNRNFKGRQGPGVRTHLASPATVAACAIAGRIADPRDILSVRGGK